MLKLVVFAVLVTAMANAKSWSRQMTIQVGAMKEDCFFIPNVKSGDHIEGEWQVTDTSGSTTGNLDIEVRVISPNPAAVAMYDSTEKAYERDDISFDQFELEISDDDEHGDYKMCFNNYMSTWSEKTVWFEINYKENTQYEDYDYDEDEYIDEEDMKSMKERNTEDATLFEMTVEEIRTAVHRVRINVGKLRHFQLMFGASMNSDGHQAMNNLEKINKWSLVHLSLILVVGLIQVFMIRQLFEDKSIFDRFSRK